MATINLKDKGTSLEEHIKRCYAAKERALGFTQIERIVNDMYETGHEKAAELLSHFAYASTLLHPELTEIEIILAFANKVGIEVKVRNMA